MAARGHAAAIDARARAQLLYSAQLVAVHEALDGPSASGGGGGGGRGAVVVDVEHVQKVRTRARLHPAALWGACARRPRALRRVGQALATARPSVPRSERAMHEALASQFMSDRSAAFGNAVAGVNSRQRVALA